MRDRAYNPRMPTRSITPGKTGPMLHSLGLLLLLTLFCLATHWGSSWVTLAGKTWGVWMSGHQLSYADRQLAIYDRSYPALVHLRDATPPDAVILLPPRQYVIDRYANTGEIPLLASPSSVYSFIYPRVPVHFGDPSPYKDRLTHILVWGSWGLDLIGMREQEVADDRMSLHPWPAGRSAPW